MFTGFLLAFPAIQMILGHDSPALPHFLAVRSIPAQGTERNDWIGGAASCHEKGRPRGKGGLRYAGVTRPGQQGEDQALRTVRGFCSSLVHILHFFHQAVRSILHTRPQSK
jgi:hypothetical protein